LYYTRASVLVQYFFYKVSSKFRIQCCQIDFFGVNSHQFVYIDQIWHHNSSIDKNWNTTCTSFAIF
jgi:hypothetical protein